MNETWLVRAKLGLSKMSAPSGWGDANIALSNIISGLDRVKADSSVEKGSCQQVGVTWTPLCTWNAQLSAEEAAERNISILGIAHVIATRIPRR